MIRSLALTPLLLALAAQAQTAPDFMVEASVEGGRVEVRARAALAAPVELVWQVISDYERLPQFVPGIARSVVLARSGDRVLVEQSGEARFLVFSVPIEVRLEVLEWPPEWIASRAVAGNLKSMSGRYEIHPDPGGGVLLRYFGVMEPEFDLPPLVGAAILRAMAEEQFAAMVREIRRRAAGGAPSN